MLACIFFEEQLERLVPLVRFCNDDEEIFEEATNTNSNIGDEESFDEVANDDSFDLSTVRATFLDHEATREGGRRNVG
ncbi:putative DNA-directed RNA polymerase II subunit RPB1 [Sesbania bispinosa]|nr:putative DNA-directed RNA polymerase II subunit RPB1 [Sesbania bispinosa]